MKKLIAASCLVFLYLMSYGQNNTRAIEVKYANGNIKEKGHVIGKAKNGIWEYYHENGKLDLKISYANDIKHGLWYKYASNGNILINGTYQHGLEYGQWRIYNEEGKISRYYEYEKVGDVLHMNVLNENKIKVEAGISKDGLRTGLWQTFCEVGHVHSEGEYLKGQKNKQWNYYGDSKNLTKTTKYTLYPDYSLSITHNNKNELIEEGKEVQGVLQGLWKYYKNNKLDKEINYKNGLAHGLYKEYWDNGKLKFSAQMKENKIDGRVEEYYVEGPISILYFMIDGEPDGDYTGYYLSGKTLEKGKFKGGKQIGNFSMFKENGKIEVIRDDQDLYTHYLENGDIDSKGRYNQEGTKIGVWTYYKNKKLFKNVTYEKGLISISREFYPSGRTKRLESYVNGILIEHMSFDYPDKDR